VRDFLSGASTAEKGRRISLLSASTTRYASVVLKRIQEGYKVRLCQAVRPDVDKCKTSTITAWNGSLLPALADCWHY